ncbi:MAG: hypothetical protein JW990_00275 [Thermoleophilia bacterium]|nr:hypothetical protein [Thermoleophilia bacterium]
MEARIIRLLEERGPQTGAELREALGNDGFAQWKACMRSDRIAVRRVGRRYLRLDQKVEGYARLSPSILREFLTYSAVGLVDDPAALESRTAGLATRIAEISAAKLRFAQRLVTEIGTRLLVTGDGGGEGDTGADVGPTGAAETRFCVLLAGDIVYGMGHDAPRPERSTGRMVRGSDLDLVVIMHDEATDELAKQIDDAIYQQKYRHLINPSVREEIDYTIKPLAKLREQAEFDTFRHMVPCKILDEAVLLYGSEELYRAAKGLLVEGNIGERLAALEKAAADARELAERHLLDRAEDRLSGDDLYLFYSSEESEEFE